MKEMRYGLAAGCVMVFCLLVGIGGAYGAVDCPPTDTGVPPSTDTPIPPTAWEPTPSSPPEETRPPLAEPSPSSPPDATATVTAGVSPDPTATVTPGVTGTPGGGTPGKKHHSTPTVVETLPVTGGGPGGGLGWTAIGMVVFLGVAFLARVGRRYAS